jgi:hypothetical protein
MNVPIGTVAYEELRMQYKTMAQVLISYLCTFEFVFFI